MAPDGLPRYRFGPRPRRGLVAGWRGGQIAWVGGSAVVAIVVLGSRPGVPSVVVAVAEVLGALGVALWPLGDRTAEEWLPVATRWAAARVTGRHRRLSPAPGAGTWGAPSLPSGTDRGGRKGPGRRPPGPRGRGAFAGLALVDPTDLARRSPGASGSGGPVPGVVFDARARTYTAALSVRGHSFALAAPEEKERRVAGWSAALASLAREGGIVHRVAWVATSSPDDGHDVGAYLAHRGVEPAGEPARRSYEELLAVAGAATCRHRVLLAVQIRLTRPVQRAARAEGGGHRGATAVLVRELESVARAVADADIVVEGTLNPSQLAGALGGAHDLDGGRGGGATVASPWPMAVEAEWGCVRADRLWHATYWIAEWPRVDVGPDFLGPLLLGPVRRSVAVVMEPVPPSRATRQVEMARTSHIADAEMRQRSGFLATARGQREAETVLRRETELADGHASFRFSGYVTVTARTRELLGGACEATEQAASQARCALRRLYGDQERALCLTMPLCRGLW